MEDNVHLTVEGLEQILAPPVRGGSSAPLGRRKIKGWGPRSPNLLRGRDEHWKNTIIGFINGEGSFY
jgi:hypothetical protein